MQEQDAASVYQFYKKVIKIRSQNPEIARGKAEYVLVGDFLAEDTKESVCAIKKTYDGSELLVIFVTGADGIRFENGKAVMPGYSVLVLK